MPKSFLDLAFDYMDGQANPVRFEDLWNFVKGEAGVSEEEATLKVSRFYTNLILDGRFIALGDNKWDLKIRHKYTEGQVDSTDYADDEADVDMEDSEEEEEYNKAFEDNSPKEVGDDEALAPETSDEDEEQTL